MILTIIINQKSLCNITPSAKKYPRINTINILCYESHSPLSHRTTTRMAFVTKIISPGAMNARLNFNKYLENQKNIFHSDFI